MKKLIAFLMALTLVLSLCACGSSKEESKKSDLDYVKEKGTLVVGITDFAPMDYKEKGSDEWVGFDADMAKEFAKSIGVKAKFVVINWKNKVMEINSKNIDCVWNGMTLTDEVTTTMDCSNAYCNNAQVVVVPKDKADKYKTAADCKKLKFAVENGSAGENVAKENGFNYKGVSKQSTAVMEVAAGTSDAAIIDSLMAAAMIGKGTSFEKLTYTVALNDEKYGVGFRKGSDLVAKINDFFKNATKDGSMQKIAETYKIQAALIK